MVTNVQINTYKNEPLSRKQKAVIAGGAALGVLTTVGVLAKKGGYSLNPKRIINTPISDMALFKVRESGNKPLEFEMKEILAMASASVFGGLLGGVVADRKNIKAKLKEAITQLFGNVLVPVLMVAKTSELYKKHEESLIKAMPQIKNTTILPKVVHYTNVFLRAVPNIVATLGSLTLGIFFGNKVTNLINEKFFHQKKNRDLKTTDFAPHIDDICMAVSMTNKNGLGTKLSRVIPLALIVPGYETGSARDE